MIYSRAVPVVSDNAIFDGDAEDIFLWRGVGEFAASWRRKTSVVFRDASARQIFVAFQDLPHGANL